MTVYLKNSIGLFYVLILIKILYITHTIERFTHILYNVKEKILVKEKDICDIIIENAIREWYISLNNKIDEKWEQPLYSKKKIEKAGRILANRDSSQEEINQALLILNNWRSSHAYPLKTITNN